MSKGSNFGLGFLIGLLLAVPAGTPLADEACDMQAISHFSIDRTEVTIGQFARFAAATGFVTKAERVGRRGDRSAVDYGVALQVYGGDSAEERDAYTVLAFARKWLSELLEDRVEVVDGEEMTTVRFC